MPVSSDMYDSAQNRISSLTEELEITDKLLSERQRVLDAIPQCEVHGSCIPHAFEWIEKAKAALSQ